MQLNRLPRPAQEGTITRNLFHRNYLWWNSRFLAVFGGMNASALLEAGTEKLKAQSSKHAYRVVTLSQRA